MNDQKNEQQHDIVIVGGGLVGLSLAAALSHARLSIALIDAAPRAAEFEREAPRTEGAVLQSGIDARVSAINPTSREFLDRIGGWPRDDVAPFVKMSVRDTRGTGAVAFDADDAQEPALGYIVENRAIQLALTRTLEASPVALMDGQRIDRIEESGEGYRVTLEAGDVMNCRLLIGADGGNSIVRKACNIRSLSWRYPQTAVVSTIQTEKPHGATARQWFTPEGPLAFLPLQDEHLCSIVWSTTDPDALLEADSGGACALLTTASERELGNVIAVDRRFSFPLQQSQAFEYVKAHLALVGDAAHTIHPLAGQGANLGLADAATLSRVLLDADFEGKPIESVSVLRQYQLRRQPMNVATAGVMEVFARLYQTDNPALNWVRNTAFRLANDQDMARSLIMRAASGR